MEQLVLRYNPDWSGRGFKQFDYTFPVWAKEYFELETIHSYNEYLHFTEDAWRGRIRTCRGIGAGLSKNKVDEFDKEYERLLVKSPTDILSIKHQLHIEIYRIKKHAK